MASTPKKQTGAAGAAKPPAQKDISFARPKGTRDIQNGEFYAYQGFFEKAAELAVYYGFKPIETPLIEKEALFTSGVGEHTDIVQKEMFTIKTKGGDALVLRPEGTAPVMRAYIEHGMHTKPQPVMLYYYGPFFRHEQPQRGRFREFFQFGLEVLGVATPITDAFIIQLAYLLLSESGFKELRVEVNSIGCKTCRPSYLKTLVAYYRRHMSKLGDHDRERLKTNPLRILDSKDPATIEFNREAPEMVGSLCEECRKHFRGVLEYLDALGIPYEIKHTLVRGLDYYSRTVFEIVAGAPPEKSEAPESGGAQPENEKPADGAKKEPSAEEEVPLALAGGGRYDYLARLLGSKRDVPSVGMSIGVDRVISAPQFVSSSPRIIKKPRVYFIQLGQEAKLKSLQVIEVLRHAHIPVAHALSKDKLSVQLAIAESLEIPYTLIMGQKESVENTVIVRDMQSRSQETVPIDRLADYVRSKMHKGRP
ncbi:MAG: histidine--tRNA ligase [Parcubacteria group bacterium]|nr:histidine--tRNA ligase [Parcubacteria group bacterium]